MAAQKAPIVPCIASAIGGALALWAFLGFDGWHGAGHIRAQVDNARADGRTEVYASTCAVTLLAQPDAVKAMTETQSYYKSDIVKKFVKGPDNKDLESNVASACANQVTAELDKRKTKS